MESLEKGTSVSVAWFDDNLFTQRASEYLRLEDERLNRLGNGTQTKWKEMIEEKQVVCHNILHTRIKEIHSEAIIKHGYK